MPLGAMAIAGLDVLIKFGVLVLTVGYFWVRDGRSYVVFGPGLLLAAAALVLTTVFAIAITLFTSVWSEGARDARFALSQVVAVWYLMTPVLYPLSEVPEAWRRWVFLNPLATLTATFKYGVFGTGDPGLPALAWTALAVGAFFVAGLWYFARKDASEMDAR
jgi:lipopolysaccharide transport system permease protein